MKKQHHITTLSLLLCFVLGMTTSCEFDKKKSNDEKTLKEKADTNTVSKSKKNNKNEFKQVFHNLPSPLELTFLFKKEGVEYSADKLHDLKAIERYNVNRKQALNLGVYGADLSYAGIFDKKQDALNYYNNCKKLTEALGIDQSNYSSFLKRLENNQNNKDTLLHIISDFFLSNDISLKESNREALTTYALIGGWVEGMYLGTQMTNNDAVLQKIKSIILMQKQSISSLIKLLNEAKETEEDVLLKKQLNELMSIYEEVQPTKKASGEVKVEEKDGKTMLHPPKSNTTLTDDIYQKIKKQIVELRTNIIR